jgi:hypothetical protein
MPPLPPAASVLKYEVLGTYEGTHWANVLHIRFSGGSSVSDMNAILTTIDASWDAHFTADLSDQLTHIESVLTDLTTDLSPRVSHSPGISGGNTGATMPASVAIGLSWPIARRYRGGHPRTYLAGVPAASVAGVSTVAPTAAANIETDAAAFLAAVNGATGAEMTALQLGALSYRTGGSPRTTPVFDPFLGGATVHSRLDTQRRRLGRELV